MLPGPRRLQGGQRHPRPPGRRRTARRRRRAAAGLRGTGAAPGGPARRRRVRAAAAGLHGHRAGHRAGHGRPGRAPAAVRRGRAAARGLGEHRRGRARGRRHLPHRADAGRRHHAVLGEGRRQGPLDALRPRAQRAPDDPSGAVPYAAAGRRARRVRARLPAAGRPGHRRTARGGGAGALGAPALRTAGPQPLHRAGRGGRLDRAARPLGARRVLPAGPRLAARAPGTAAGGQRQRRGAADVGLRPGRRRGGDPARDRAAAPAAATGADRVRGHGLRRAARSRRCTRWTRWGCGSPSTTSAPATPTSPT